MKTEMVEGFRPFSSLPHTPYPMFPSAGHDAFRTQTRQGTLPKIVLGEIKSNGEEGEGHARRAKLPRPDTAGALSPHVSGRSQIHRAVADS